MESWRVFVIVTPGLEELALKEIQLKLPLENYDIVKGGIELDANLEWIEHAHLLLKIPTRLLLRLTNFKVRDFPKLHSKMAGFSWNKFLSHPEPLWEISASKSRLNHTGRIEETIREALKDALTRQPLSLEWQKKNYPPQTFYVRLFDDELTLSLDLTGEPLFKRGFQKIKGEAPIRENLAAALVMQLFEGVQEEQILVDPMCGSGTFLTEALTFHLPLHERPFAFETAPFYKGRTLLVRKAPPQQKLPAIEARGFDLNEDLVKKVQKELESKLPVKLEVKDSLKERLPSDAFMICNPPYGERIKVEGKRGSFLKSAWEKFLEEDQPRRFGWVLPSDMDDLFKQPKNYTLKSKLQFRNGGMAVTYWIWDRK